MNDTSTSDPNIIWAIDAGSMRAIRCALDNSSLSMNFRSFELSGGGGQIILIGDEADAQSLDKWDRVDWEIDGTLKWDGCVDWHTNRNHMAHACGPDIAQRLARTFDCVYAIGARLISRLDIATPPLPADIILTSIDQRLLIDAHLESARQPGDRKPELHVIMGNDFPAGIMSDGAAAKKLCEERNAENAARMARGEGRIYWRANSFTLDQVER